MKIIKYISIFVLMFVAFGCTKVTISSTPHAQQDGSAVGCLAPKEIALIATPQHSNYTVLADIILTEHRTKGRSIRLDDQLEKIIRMEAYRYCADAVVDIRFTSHEDTIRTEYDSGYTEYYTITGKAIRWY